MRAHAVGHRPGPSRDLVAEAVVEAAPGAVESAFRADPGGWLPLPARRRGLGRWTVGLRGPLMTRTVSCGIGPTWVVEDGAWRSVHWKPEAERSDPLSIERALPRFHGELGVRTEDGPPTVCLQGRYRVPGGRVGALFDTVLVAVAGHTARRFVHEIAERLAATSGPDRLLSQSRSARARRSAR